MKIEFKEEQNFRQWWLWIILIGLGILPIYGIYKQLILGEAFGDNPMPDFGLIVLAIFMFGIMALFWFMELKTEIDQKELRMKFIPFVKKTAQWKDVKSAKILNYGFAGGWGIRIGTKYGTIYNTKGNKGLAIELKSGKKFLIGTQKEAELTKVLKKCL